MSLHPLIATFANILVIKKIMQLYLFYFQFNLISKLRSTILIDSQENSNFEI